MNGFGKVVEEPAGSGNFVFKLNPAPVTLADVVAFSHERFGNETHDRYWANFIEPVPRLSHNGLAKPQEGDVVTLLVYYPPYVKRNDVDWNASRYNPAWLTSPWVAGKDPYRSAGQAHRPGTVPGEERADAEEGAGEALYQLPTAVAGEARIDHELLMRSTTEARRPGQTYDMRPRSNYTWIDYVHDLRAGSCSGRCSAARPRCLACSSSCC